MFQDTLLPNLVIFAIGLYPAFYWLRTGMIRRGFLLLAMLATLADVALVARFVFEDDGRVFAWGLGLLQALSLGAALWLSFKLLRRRFAADAKRGPELIAAAFRHYLRDELTSAAALFRRVRSADPWSVPATIGLANVLWRQGVARRARALYRRAGRLDRENGYGDFIAEQLRRLDGQA